MRKKLIAIGIIVIALIAVGGWFARKPLLAWHYLQNLESTADESKVPYPEIAELHDATVPRLIVLLQREHAPSERACKALAEIAGSLPEDDPALTRMAAQLAAAFPGLRPDGRCGILSQVVEPLLNRCPACKDSCCEIVKFGLKDAYSSHRAAAIVLALRRDIALGRDVLPLLTDTEAEVRRSAMLAVGTSPELIGAEELLRWLHDDDREVRDLCEAALKSRGLRDKDVRMAKLVTDPSFLKRLEVIGYLPDDNEVDPHAWLQRLSQDPVPAVRAAAARAGLGPDLPANTGFRDRVREMARNDPDGTVRQIAATLLQGGQRQ